jgi:hypothetical protein
MSCSACKRDKPIVARDYCAACYQRWHKTGTTDYQRWGKRSVCSVGGCEARAITKGLCDTHRKRMERHGHMEETRPDSWGAKEKHPLYNAWAHMRRYRANHPMVPEWEDDFLQFIIDVGERPSPKHKLFVADDTQPIGPDNYVWKRAITEMVPGEDVQTYMNRAQKVYRAVRTEAFKGYELKKRFGMSNADYDAMMEAQDGKCAICGGEESLEIRGKTITLAVDHCHAKGHIRALLCSNCNRGLGLFGDDPALLRAAASYLERHAEMP